MLDENRRASNVRISVFIHSRYSSLYAKYILGTPEFAELTNIGEYYSENQFFAIIRQFMRERPRILMNIRYSPILVKLTCVRFRLKATTLHTCIIGYSRRIDEYRIFVIYSLQHSCIIDKFGSAKNVFGAYKQKY